jgi:uncharacterized protein VirK/YbjX
MSIFRTISLLHSASHRAFPVGRNGSVAKRLKFVCRSWPQREFNLAWFEHLQSDDFMRKLADFDHRVYRKLYRPYLSTSWDKNRALEALKANYTVFRAKLPPSIAENIYLSDSFILAEWVANRKYQVRLAHDQRFYQEGEITMSLLCPELGEGELAQISGTVAPDDEGVMAFYIGGLQGAARELGAPAIKEAGRDLHGLRPKSLIVIAAQLLAGQLGCQRILATSTACHAYSTDDRRQSKEKQKMFFDYDSFWEECEGSRINGAFFSLPLTTARRAREEMKPQKRPMYQRRYAMLDEIEAAVAGSLTISTENQA